MEDLSTTGEVGGAPFPTWGSSDEGIGSNRPSVRGRPGPVVSMLERGSAPSPTSGYDMCFDAGRPTMHTRRRRQGAPHRQPRKVGLRVDAMQA